MLLINLNCVDSESFKQSIQLYLDYYNIKNNHARVSQLNNNLNPYIHIKFNKNIDILQFEKDSPHINLFMININSKPVFLTGHNAPITITIVQVNDHRYSLFKPSIYTFNSNINEINTINKIDRDKHKNYKLTDEIKKDLCLHFQISKSAFNIDFKPTQCRL